MVLISVIFLISACSEQSLTNNAPLSSSSEDILEQCKCTKDCYGEKIYGYCIHKNVETPQQCKEFVGIYLGQSYDASVKYYFDDKHLDTCYNSLISRQTDVKLCADFPEDYSFVCFNDVGKRTLTPEYCKDIPYSFKSDCYLHISENDADFGLNLCDELDRQDRVTCYANKATLNEDSTICLELEDDSDKINCYSQIDENFEPKFERQNYVPIYYNWFVEADFDKNLINESYCEFENTDIKVDEIRRNDSCYMSLAMYHSDLDECYNLPTNFLGQNLARKCLFYTAMWNDFEISDCDRLGIDFKECREGVILSKRSPELCRESYESPTQQGDCIHKLAIDYYGVYRNRDFFLCGEIEGQGKYKNECLSKTYDENDVDFQTKEVCDILSTTNDFLSLAMKCYYNVALKNLDLDSCEQIDGHDTLKTDCKERVEKALEKEK
ncbi:hypothetical protein CMO93_04275 [Candidatus Woesearchaeota archaeon]|nr:hypothetical protein [Candidatus Woesearchaeota archaeon]|tara:strand:+ start:835 stop:2151 length:1317 start_codon:yes stop_codon:yes gene_type:complete